MHEEEEWTFTYYIRTRAYKLALHSYVLIRTHSRVSRRDVLPHIFVLEVRFTIHTNGTRSRAARSIIDIRV